MNLKFLKEEALEHLKNNIDENLSNYKKDEASWIDKDYFGEYDKPFPDFKLNTSEKDPGKTDFNNIQILYLNLKNLKDSQAIDERVWAGLCHNQFLDYMKYRWPPTSENIILQHYFFGKDHPTFLNGLARLWWTGRLTYDETLKNPFELTEYLCNNDFNGRGSALFAVNFSNNKNIIRVFLRTLMEFEKKRKLSRDEFQKVKKILVLWGGKMVLDSLTHKELSEKIKNYLESNFL